jgi:hypothetical protein
MVNEKIKNQENRIDKSIVKFQDFDTEVILDDNEEKFGRIDLQLKVKDEIFLFEIKVEINTSLSKHQPTSYLKFLKNKNENLFFIIPNRYFHRNGILEKWEDETKYSRKDIENHNIIYWEDILKQLRKQELDKADIFINEFCEIIGLNWFDFEKIEFTKDELDLIFNDKEDKGYKMLENINVPVLMSKLFQIIDCSTDKIKYYLKNKDKQNFQYYGYFLDNEKLDLSEKLSIWFGVIAEQKMIGSISKIKKEIDKLEKSIHSTDKDIDKIELVKNINEIDDEQNSLSDKILTLDLKIKNIIMTKEILTSDDQIYLIDELNSIYNYASINIESVLNDYKESLTFHNQLLSTKKEFILDGLEDLKRERLNCNEKAIKLKRIKDNLYLELKSKKKIEELSDTVRQIGDLNKELIRFSSVIEEKDTIQSKKDDKDSELEKLSNELKKELINVDKFEKTLVKNFKNYTKEFYNVEYNFSLNLDKDKSECTPSVDEIESNNEGGLKRLEVILFDLSYIKTVNEENVNRVNFVLHDSIDDIDIEHIKKIFLESSKLSGQHILSMLSDKLTAEQYTQYKKYIILELSEDDKFFTV